MKLVNQIVANVRQLGEVADDLRLNTQTHN